ncbi:MAG: cysteine--tRNA ligase [Candidatus Magasanikbacteria bacterium RIFCSPHIGHO2_02_FULL_50_9b]|uniref:Cysteine--tRNA ligase n=1 Tax=Candidatus Magasanikbacteria bacterium RIFCSPHIGHO2_02_FULL_50_9b TaxID=1798682 RepID=A0A1F6M7Q5_9BACT|nr:MAG: cysteine--tRNA ligase [Candidatus Magasanikbacteria bacterium RIFCSPHIGHO2_02_FULL_50_9b]
MKNHLNQLSLFNTLTRTKEVFKPLKKKTVTMYNCGPTVYHDQHIGNFRTAMTVDLLKRTLLHFGYAVKHITNITDVGHLTDDVGGTGEDRMQIGARREGLTALQVARKYEKLYRADIQSLNNIPPFKWTRATEHIVEQIALVKKLERLGFTYHTSDGIYFNVKKCNTYGALAGLASVRLQAGKRVALGDKKNPQDFALWKFAAPGVARQMEWQSPWGVGFPGWHIECSAMAMKYLGSTIDIHLGGIDLIPVHHTNEIAQAESVTHKQFVRYWVHGAFVLEGEEKMSKSKGNVKTMTWIRENNFSPLDYRYLTLQTHYRKELSVSVESLAAARTAHQQIVTFILSAPRRGGKIITDKLKKFDDAIADDLNMPRAIAVLWDVLNGTFEPADKRATILKFDEVFGLNLRKEKHAVVAVPPMVTALVKKRAAARAEKQWATSDALREEIKKLGWDVSDTPSGQTVAPVLY